MERGKRLEESGSQRNLLIGSTENHGTIRVGKTRDQTFGSYWADLFWRKVHHRHHETPHQFVQPVMFGDLGTALLDTQFRSKIHP